MNLSKSVTRLITGVIFGFTALFAIMAGGLYLVALVLAIVILASKEYVKVLQHKGFRPSSRIIIASSLIFAALAYFNRFDLVALAFSVCSIMAFMSVYSKVNSHILLMSQLRY